MSRSVQKRAWLESDRKLRAAWEGAGFAGKPDSLWQTVCKKVSGGWEFSAPVVEEAKPKRVRKKKEA